MKKVLTLLFACSLVMTLDVSAAAPICHSSHGGYCTYTGTVKHIYVNSSNLILIYFDTPMAASEPAKAGFSASKTNAAAFVIGDNPEFAKLFYSTALAAQASGRKISIQMRDVYSGYLKFDRIWLAES